MGPKSSRHIRSQRVATRWGHCRCEHFELRSYLIGIETELADLAMLQWGSFALRALAGCTNSDVAGCRQLVKARAILASAYKYQKPLPVMTLAGKV